MSELEQTHTQIEEQLANNGSATVLIERSDNKISTGQIFGRGERGAKAFLGDLSDPEAHRIPTRFVRAETLTDAYQTKLAEELAGVALSGAGVEQDSNNFANIWSTSEEAPSVEDAAIRFSPERASLERAIEDANAAKRQAQLAGNGADSIYWGQVAGKYTKELRNL